jgi:DNA-binding NtrC family response regulator
MHDVLLLDGDGMAEVAHAVRGLLGDGAVVRTVDADGLAPAIPERWNLLMIPAAALPRARDARDADPTLPIVVVAPHGDVDLAARVVAAGATDLLVTGERLADRVATLFGKVRPWVRLSERARGHDAAERARWALLGDSPEIRALKERIRRVGAIPRPVLVLGERGTGKELVARAIHAAGSAGPRPLVCVNCAAFPDALLETELFGHERGAFTGADRRAAGRFEQADGGTLFLDEVACMSLPFQQKVLRAVEYGTFTRVGGADEVRTTARIVAATNADLPARIAAGQFLPDLYDRLAFDVLRVPALRERAGDVELLAGHFLAAFQREIPSTSGRRLSRAALDAMRAYAWPGNVRELKHVVERAAYREGPDEIGVDDLGLAGAAPAGGFEERVEAFKRALLRDALRASDGNGAAAARALGVSYDQLRYYLKRLG